MPAKIDLNPPKNLPVAAARTSRYAVRVNRVPPAMDIGRRGLEAWP
jgi:hypothetical protein